MRNIAACHQRFAHRPCGGETNWVLSAKIKFFRKEKREATKIQP